MIGSKLIHLGEVNRPIRKARVPVAFSLLQIRSLAEIGMGEPSESDVQKAVAELYEAWFTPAQVAAYATSCVGSKGAGAAIWTLLKAGMIEALSGSSSRTSNGRGPVASQQINFVPKSLWRSVTFSTGTDFWGGAYARFYTDSTTYQHFGIRLNPLDLQANLPPPRPVRTEHPPAERFPSKENQEAAEQVAPNKGGRPRKEWWDDFWIAIGGQIYEGKLIPKTQADLERAMFDWVQNQGHDVGETTIKKAARKLFAAWGFGGSKT